MIEASQLSRRYGDFIAVDGVSFAVDEGEIVGILGPNGAGKTTTIRMVTGFLPPSAGTVTVSGVDLFREPARARREIGYLPENVAVYPEMRVQEYLAYRAQLEGMGGKEAATAIDDAVEACMVSDVRRQVIGTLSKGYRQRLGLAAAILHRPAVLVLDEPTVGLDPGQIVAIRERIRELGARHTILLSTHILPEVELLCSRVLIIDEGRIVAEGTPESLRRDWSGPNRLRVEIEGRPPSALEVLERLVGPGAVTVEPAGAADNLRLNLSTEQGTDLRAEVFRAAVEQGWTLLELASEQASLEDIFVRLTTRESLAGAQASHEDDEVDPGAVGIADGEEVR